MKEIVRYPPGIIMLLVRTVLRLPGAISLYRLNPAYHLNFRRPLITTAQRAFLGVDLSNCGMFRCGVSLRPSRFLPLRRTAFYQAVRRGAPSTNQHGGRNLTAEAIITCSPPSLDAGFGPAVATIPRTNPVFHGASRL